MKFLHISDLHYDPVNDYFATKQLREALERKIKDKFIVDEVFFTGDFRHAKNQKDQNQDDVAENAIKFLRKIAGYFGVTEDNHIHIVPGNHDFDDYEDCGEDFTQIYKNYTIQRGRFDGKTKNGEEYLGYLRGRFGFFEKCVQLLGNELWQNFKDGDVHRLKLFDRYNILYINTAIAASGYKDIRKGKRPNLYLGLDYIGKVLEQLDTKTEKPVIILAHNTLEHVDEEERQRIRLLFLDKNISTLWLCGDAHKPYFSNVNDIGYITAGSLIQEDDTIATFNIGTLDDDGCFSFETYHYDSRNNGWGKNEVLTERNNAAIPKDLQPRNKKLFADNNLPEQNEYFSGRKADIIAIDKLFKQKEITAINICQTVAGLGGIGKTQLAIEYAYRYGGNYESCVWFIVAESSNTVYNYFMDFANHFKIALPPEFNPEDLQWAIKGWLHDHNNWFLIFDNLENYDDVAPYLPNSSNGHFIITTRKENVDIGVKLGLGVFSISETLEFFQKRLVGYGTIKDFDFTDFDEKASILAERLGCLPLALAQAAAYIVNVKCSISDYIRYIENEKYNLRLFIDKYGTPEHYTAIVNTTWNIAMSKFSDEAKALFNLCAYMAPDKIPVKFFVEMRHKLPSELSKLHDILEDEMNRNSLLTDLRSYSLSSGNNRYINIHRLVQEVVRKRHELEN